MDNQTYIIEFGGASAAEAGSYADELRSTLLDASRNIKVDKKRGEGHTQDFGGTLVLVLSAQSVVVAAKALADWLKLRNSASIDIKTAKGRIIAKNLTSKDAASLIEQKLKQNE
jgi:hypothetical protein